MSRISSLGIFQSGKMAEAGSSPSRPATVEDVEEVQELQEGDFTVEVVQAAGEEEEGVVLTELKVKFGINAMYIFTLKGRDKKRVRERE